MRNSKISVIIPVYNAEKTIGNILSKLIAQKYKNVEIIVVNDGSTDSSLKILQDFVKKDDRIIVYSQKNSGASSARNSGIKIATGDYLMFVDSDDDISERLVSELASKITHNTDFVMCSMSINGKQIKTLEKYIVKKKTIPKYILHSLLTKNLLYGPCCKLFRRDIIEIYNIRFPEEIKYGEDTIFNLDYFCHISNVSTINQALYLYNYPRRGIAYLNYSNNAFYSARNKALNHYISVVDFSIIAYIYYILTRVRWLLAYMKSSIRKIYA